MRIEIKSALFPSLMINYSRSAAYIGAKIHTQVITTVYEFQAEDTEMKKVS